MSKTYSITLIAFIILVSGIEYSYGDQKEIGSITTRKYSSDIIPKEFCDQYFSSLSSLTNVSCCNLEDIKKNVFVNYDPSVPEKIKKILSNTKIENWIFRFQPFSGNKSDLTEKQIEILELTTKFLPIAYNVIYSAQNDKVYISLVLNYMPSSLPKKNTEFYYNKENDIFYYTGNSSKLLISYIHYQLLELSNYNSIKDLFGGRLLSNSIEFYCSYRKVNDDYLQIPLYFSGYGNGFERAPNVFLKRKGFSTEELTIPLDGRLGAYKSLDGKLTKNGLLYDFFEVFKEPQNGRDVSFCKVEASPDTLDYLKNGLQYLQLQIYDTASTLLKAAYSESKNKTALEGLFISEWALNGYTSAVTYLKIIPFNTESVTKYEYGESFKKIDSNSIVFVKRDEKLYYTLLKMQERGQISHKLAIIKLSLLDAKWYAKDIVTRFDIKVTASIDSLENMYNPFEGDTKYTLPMCGFTVLVPSKSKQDLIPISEQLSLNIIDRNYSIRQIYFAGMDTLFKDYLVKENGLFKLTKGN